MSKLGSEGRRLVSAGALLLAGAALAAAWELLARQAPGTLLYIGMLPGPIASLRELCFTLGASLIVAGALFTPRADEPAHGARFAILAMAGALSAALAQLYAASQGMNGVQLQDPRSDALPTFVLRHGGTAACVIALCALAWRALRPINAATVDRQDSP